MVCCDYADPFVSDDGLECRSCQQALVPASTGAALDVTALYRAIENVTEEWDDMDSKPSVIFAGSQYDLRERIAAEYARLAEQEGDR